MSGVKDLSLLGVCWLTMLKSMADVKFPAGHLFCNEHRFGLCGLSVVKLQSTNVTLDMCHGPVIYLAFSMILNAHL